MPRLFEDLLNTSMQSLGQCSLRSAWHGIMQLAKSFIGKQWHFEETILSGAAHEVYKVNLLEIMKSDHSKNATPELFAISVSWSA